LSGRLIKFLGKENAIMIGLIFMMVQQLMLSSLVKIEDQQHFLEMSFV